MDGSVQRDYPTQQTYPLSKVVSFSYGFDGPRDDLLEHSVLCLLPRTAHCSGDIARFTKVLYYLYHACGLVDGR